MQKMSVPFLAIALLIASPVFAQSKVEPAVAVRTVPPEYPERLRAQQVTGLVVIKCTVDEQGNVVSPAVEKSTDEGFNQPALDAIRKWKFKPARQDGNPVSKTVIIPIRFAIE
jgi:periplasmic protein TonB